jgi:hypothetical protein
VKTSDAIRDAVVDLRSAIKSLIACSIAYDKSSGDSYGTYYEEKALDEALSAFVDALIPEQGSSEQ